MESIQQKFKHHNILLQSDTSDSDQIIYRFRYELLKVDMYVCEPDDFGCTLLYLTGSKWFNIRLRKYA
jgi:DNA polymerase/3'-5' exonuclease PolX